MAVKKIKLDFSKVEERSGWNTRQMPEGLHEFKVESVQETEAGDGTDMLVYALRPVSSKYKTRLFPFYCKLQQNQYWKLRDLLVAAGITVPKRAGMIDPNGPVGKTIACEVEDATGQYAGRSEIQGTFDKSILDDDGAEPSDDEDEDELDEDEQDEDEDEEGLETMTLPELKKLAKSLGITGYTKLDEDALIEAIEEAQEEAEDEGDEDELDDDDLDDEELEDEEFEDDEDEDEEPEPAPRRRAPAKKTAAKAAPTKRRVVRR